MREREREKGEGGGREKVRKRKIPKHKISKEKPLNSWCLKSEILGIIGTLLEFFHFSLICRTLILLYFS